MKKEVADVNMRCNWKIQEQSKDLEARDKMKGNKKK